MRKRMRQAVIGAFDGHDCDQHRGGMEERSNPIPSDIRVILAASERATESDHWWFPICEVCGGYASSVSMTLEQTKQNHHADNLCGKYCINNNQTEPIGGRSSET